MLLIFWLSGCKKLVEVDAPVTSTNAGNVYTSDATAAAVLTGIYAKMSRNSFLSEGITSISFLPALSSDELTLYSAVTNTALVQYYKNELTSSDIGTIHIWNGVYPILFASNAAIEGLNGSTSLTQAVKQQLLGEAKFIRAFCNFYLVNLYGDVPLVMGTNWQENAQLARSPQNQVWSQIINDLKDAQELLNAAYVESDAVTSTSITERVRPNKWAATALLARAYLYTGDYANAETASTAVIDNATLYSLPDLSQTFLKTSGEAIWQLQPVIEGYNTVDASVFVLPPTGPTDPNYPVYLSPFLLQAIEDSDRRKTEWVDSVVVPTQGTPMVYYYAKKYKVAVNGSPVTEYTMVLRLAEQYLIRAEAKAHQNNPTGAKNDVNVIRTRAGLPDITANDKAALLLAIEKERQAELFTEWGHRWLDLKRTNRIDAVLSAVAPLKGGTWQTTDRLYPIPQTDLQRNRQLTQNPGYQ